MKYITAKLPGQLPAAFPFSPHICHKLYADRLQLTPEMIIGAGFYRIETGANGLVHVECAGFSPSLNRGPAPGDAALIAASHELTNREYPARPRSSRS